MASQCIFLQRMASGTRDLFFSEFATFANFVFLQFVLWHCLHHQLSLLPTVEAIISSSAPVPWPQMLFHIYLSLQQLFSTISTSNICSFSLQQLLYHQFCLWSPVEARLVHLYHVLNLLLHQLEHSGLQQLFNMHHGLQHLLSTKST